MLLTVTIEPTFAKVGAFPRPIAMPKSFGGQI